MVSVLFSALALVEVLLVCVVGDLNVTHCRVFNYWPEHVL